VYSAKVEKEGVYVWAKGSYFSNHLKPGVPCNGDMLFLRASAKGAAGTRSTYMRTGGGALPQPPIAPMERCGEREGVTLGHILEATGDSTLVSCRHRCSRQRCALQFPHGEQQIVSPEQPILEVLELVGLGLGTIFFLYSTVSLRYIQRARGLGEPVVRHLPVHRAGAPRGQLPAVPSVRGPGQEEAAKRFSMCACTMIFNLPHFSRSGPGTTTASVWSSSSSSQWERRQHRGGHPSSLCKMEYPPQGTPWPWRLRRSKEGFQTQCVLMARGVCEWIMFADVNEYLYPAKLVKHSPASRDDEGAASCQQHDASALVAE